jgi:4-carboxymuconolactone decarboxylase
VPEEFDTANVLRVIDMARMKGIEPHEAGWFTRLIYWVVRRKVGKMTGQNRLIEPIKITAHHPRLLKALGQMETGQAAARSVPAPLKSLASIKAAILVGCPY